MYSAEGGKKELKQELALLIVSQATSIALWPSSQCAWAGHAHLCGHVSHKMMFMKVWYSCLMPDFVFHVFNLVQAFELSVPQFPLS